LARPIDNHGARVHAIPMTTRQSTYVTRYDVKRDGTTLLGRFATLTEAQSLADQAGGEVFQRSIPWSTFVQR